MKINRLETHDRLQHLQKDQALVLAKGAEDCLLRNTLSLGLQQYSPYIYIFAHPRTHDDGVTKRMLWQPRLTKPKMEPNSYLFKAQSRTDLMEIKWLLPPKEMWGEYRKGNVTENELVLWSINQYASHRHAMEQPDAEDLSDQEISNIYARVYRELKEEEARDKMILQPGKDFMLKI